MSHLNVSHVMASHHILSGLVSSHHFNRTPSHRIISYLIISHNLKHHLPLFLTSLVIPLLQPSEKPLPHCIAFVHPPGPQVR